MNGGLGRIAFLIGIIGAIIIGLLEGWVTALAATWILVLLGFVGVVIGLINITAKESVPFMVAGLVVAGVSGLFAFVPMGGAEILQNVFEKLFVVVGPAVAVVALKVIYSKAR